MTYYAFFTSSFFDADNVERKKQGKIRDKEEERKVDNDIQREREKERGSPCTMSNLPSNPFLQHV